MYRGVLLALIVVGGVQAETPKEAPKEAPKEYTGQVLPLAKMLEKQGLKADADSGLALIGKDGKTYTIVKDKTTRFLLMDERLHGRTVQVSARLLSGTQMLQVVEVFTVKDGKPHEVYYWCQNCALRASEPGACICCGGATELLEVPVKKK